MEMKKTKIEDFLAIPDILSLLNMSAGLLSIICAINHQFMYSAILMIIALLFDSVDGYVARKLNREDIYGFGKNIDSLSDVISFGVSPAIFLYTISQTIPNSPSILVILTSLLITICGVLRLTRYNVLSNYIDQNTFIGFPIPGIALILSLFYINNLFNIYVVLIFLIISSFLMISNVKYDKINNMNIILITLILLILTLIIVFTSYMNIPGIILLLLVIFYLLKNLFKN
ncbi:archaetidylserine synthase [Methanobrevibacter sp. DSM 116169]|uniref:archaetidylserine synthase n=1 Tax=Methanobrevibacter sp. DSM 116169 TaxID=3242727 RepID=UPI0038FBEC2C